MNIKEFNLNDIPQYFSMIVNGVRRSGKSRITDWMINQIYNKKNHNFDDCYLLSSTAGQQDDVFQFVKKENIIDELSDENINKIFEKREAIMEHYKQNPKNFKTPPNCLIIIDDLLNDKNGKSLWHSKPVSQLFFKGRHMGCSIIVLTQYVKSLSPLMRCNADILVYFRDLREDNRKCILQEYLSFSNNKEIIKQGEQIMTDITSKRYHAMVVNRYMGQYSSSFEEYVFWMKSAEKYNNKKVKFKELPKGIGRTQNKTNEKLKNRIVLDKAKNKEVVNESFKEDNPEDEVKNYKLRIYI